MIVCCIECCWKSIETIVEFLTKHAYIETCLYGLGLTESAKNSMAIVKSNFLNLGTVIGLCDLLIFSQSLITSGSITLLFWLGF